MDKYELKNKVKEMIENDKMFKSVILSSKNHELGQEVAFDIARMFFCDSANIEADSCKACKRFKSSNIIDFIKIGDGVSAITKTEILELISRFSLTSMESFNKKIYVINAAENMKVEAANSLLKFLEEPPQNTYAILISKNKSEILPTIKSRCASLILDDNAGKKIKNNFLLDLITLPKKEILLSNLKIKKMDKIELLELSENAFNAIKQSNSNNPELLEIWLEFIDDLRFSFAKNISIDNWLIRITEVI